MKKALVLGGGGARGLSQIGVLKVLEREGFWPDLIVGCSIGAIIGGMYAQNPRIDVLEKRAFDFFGSSEYGDFNINVLENHHIADDDQDFIHQIARNIERRVLLNIVASRESILNDDRLGKAVRYLVEKGKIEDTQIPFACNATDLVSGEPVLFTKGDIHNAIKASGSIPGYLPPVHYNSKVLVDGAVSYALPIKFARSLGADFVIAVDVKQKLRPQSEYLNVFDVILRAGLVTASVLSEEIPDKADILIQPEVDEYFWYDFRRADQIIRAGEEAVDQHLNEIRKHIGKSAKNLLKNLFKNN